MTTAAVGVSVSLLPGTSDIGEMRVPLPHKDTPTPDFKHQAAA
jgi:hypothetical protein